MKKRALRKEFFMEIRKSLPRFLSILFIVALGTAFYSGIQSSSPDMRYSGDAYFDAKELSDIQVTGTMGVTGDDVEALQNLKDIETAEGVCLKDVLTGEEGQRKVLRILSIPEKSNLVTVEEGEYPTKEDECLMDVQYAEHNGYQIGDTFRISEELEKDEDATLKSDTFTITGLCSSPLYISFSRGSTNVGNGEIAGFVYVPQETFTTDYYMQIYLKVKGAKELTAYTDAYDTTVAQAKEQVESIEKERCSRRQEEIKDEAQEKVSDAKTEHKEVAPCQFELAPVFTSTNIANDQNQLTMEVLQKVASHHGLVCLLHEKPFDGINGSGKHNNWSMVTNEGENILEPGDSPKDNIRFLTVLAAIIKGVDEYQDLLRISVASAGNDHRLGADEAPPAIISIYLGEELTAILEAIEAGNEYVDTIDRKLELGVSTLPPIAKDSTDRNRTSPFAFTGNKFEFRMLGSNLNISCPNTILNTIVAEELTQFADELECVKQEDMTKALIALIQKTLKNHKRIIFSGNGYSDEWKKEAQKRGLLELKTTADALPHYTDPKNLQLFEKHNVYSASELHARESILLTNYYQVVQIEAKTMAYMLRKQILPAIFSYEAKLAQIIQTKKSSGIEAPLEVKILKNINTPLELVSNHLDTLESLINKETTTEKQAARFAADELLPLMETIRQLTDVIETNVSKEDWPLPDYNDILFKSML